ncbi:DoxX family protein [Nocardia sp. NPDC058176]|uniref:DoxX family protein n=1 Tax=Nocardia sp. NPDC058176 TaxID=3346368 RepID=UPI0036DAFDD6
MSTRTTSLIRSRGLEIARWVPVAAVLAETAVGAYWDLARISYVRAAFDHLGYPLYFATVLGVAKTAALAAILTPGHPHQGMGLRRTGLRLRRCRHLAPGRG